MSSESTPVRVVVDRSRCCGYGLCAVICPELYKLDAEGLVFLETDQVPVHLLEEAREGAASCPAEVITLEPLPS